MLLAKNEKATEQMKAFKIIECLANLLQYGRLDISYPVLGCIGLLVKVEFFRKEFENITRSGTPIL